MNQIMNQLNHILIYIVQLNCIILLLESGYRYLVAIFQGLCGVFVLSHLIIGSSFLVKILFHICIHGHFSTKIYVFKEERITAEKIMRTFWSLRCQRNSGQQSARCQHPDLVMLFLLSTLISSKNIA